MEDLRYRSDAGFVCKWLESHSGQISEASCSQQLWRQGTGSSQSEPACTRLPACVLSCSIKIAMCVMALFFSSVGLGVGRPIIFAALLVMPDSLALFFFKQTTC